LLFQGYKAAEPTPNNSVTHCVGHYEADVHGCTNAAGVMDGKEAASLGSLKLM